MGRPVRDQFTPVMDTAHFATEAATTLLDFVNHAEMSNLPKDVMQRVMWELAKAVASYAQDVSTECSKFYEAVRDVKEQVG